MVKYYSEPLDMIFFALADATRRGILLSLKNEYKSASELAEPFSISLAAISKHLKILEKSGLITRKKDGRNHYFQINHAPFDEATDWIAFFNQFWVEKLDNLEALLESSDEDTL